MSPKSIIHVPPLLAIEIYSHITPPPWIYAAVFGIVTYYGERTSVNIYPTNNCRYWLFTQANISYSTTASHPSFRRERLYCIYANNICEQALNAIFTYVWMNVHWIYAIFIYIQGERRPRVMVNISDMVWIWFAKSKIKTFSHDHPIMGNVHIYLCI